MLNLCIDEKSRQVERLRSALSELANAQAYSMELGVDIWTFAVEIQVLRADGLTDNDLRWLVCKGYVDHAGEVTPLGQDERSFRNTGRFRFCRRTCFILTESGEEFYRVAKASGYDGDITNNEPGRVNNRNGYGEKAVSLVCPSRPHWDPDRQELRLGREVVKQFKVPAPNQELVLAAFEEENWPHRIDDPIPPHYDMDPKRRLHDTINSLNRCQKTALLRFLGDGSGKGVRWEAVNPSATGSPVGRVEGWGQAVANGHL